MYHLDNSSGVATRPDIPAVKNAQVCWFTEGGNGVPPSYPGAHWFNIIQAELLNVLNEAGVSPQKAQLNQLTIAIKKIIDNKIADKAALNHTHAIAGVTGLPEALQGLSEKGKALDEKKEDKLVESVVDLRNLNQDYWYPLVFSQMRADQIYCFVVKKFWGDVPTWAAHTLGFTLYCAWEDGGRGWGLINHKRIISRCDYSHIKNNISPIINIGQLYRPSFAFCYLRGGSRYQILTDKSITATLHPEGYRWQDVNNQYSDDLPIITEYSESLVPYTERQITEQNYVAKSGDTMTGPLNINHVTSYLRGKNNGVDDWFVGRVRNNDNDVALASYQHSTGVHLKADRVESNKPIYRGTNQVFDEGNLLPVKHINLRATIPGTTIEYQNATPSELPLGSYAGFTTNAQLSGSGTFSGWGFVSKIDNTQAFRQAVNFDRHFAQWGNTTNGWGGVYEYFMLRPQLGTSDLNNVTVCGVYAQILNANALPTRNYPVQESGTLLVTPSAFGGQQEYTTFLANKKFVRGRNGSGWLPWKRIDALDSVSKAGDQMGSLEINQGHKITTSHYGLGSYAAQYDSGAPFFVSQNASVARDTYHPFVKGKVRSHDQYGAAFSFGYTTNQRTDGQDGFGRGVLHLAEDNGRNCVWNFEHDGSFIAGDVATFAGKRLSNAMMAGDVAVLTGEIAHGGTIPLPAGFTQEQCKWAVMPRVMYDRGGADINSFQVYADANRLVTVHSENGVHSNNRATYIIIGSR